MKEREENAKR